MTWRDVFFLVLVSLLWIHAIYFCAMVRFYREMAETYRTRAQRRERRRNLARMLSINNSMLLGRTKPFLHRCHKS